MVKLNTDEIVHILKGQVGLLNEDGREVLPEDAADPQAVPCASRVTREEIKRLARVTALREHASKKAL